MRFIYKLSLNLPNIVHLHYEMRFLYIIYQIFIGWPLVAVIAALTSIVVIIGSIFGSAHFWGYYPYKICGILTLKILLIPVKIEGREHIDKHKSYVFVANHQGGMDIFLIYGHIGRNFKWMMKKSLRKMPLVGFACEKAHHIFVDKSGPKAIKKTYDDARATLQGGTSLVVFPEGARTFTGHMGFFRKGAFSLAQEIGLPIVPVTIDGSFDLLPRQRGMIGILKWHRLRLVIHPAISSEDIKEAMDSSYKTIMSDLPERHQGYEKNDDQ